MKIFIVNRYLHLKLKDDTSYIYVGDKEILMCKKVGINIVPSEIEEYLKYKSIDNLEGVNYEIDEEVIITPETEFFVHCSNLQIWEKNGYNTDLIHSSVAFPILKELAEIGDLRAKRVFKEEIVKRFLNGNRNVQEYLIIEGYIRCLSPLERETVFGKDAFRFKSLESHIGHRIEIVTSCNQSKGVTIQDKRVTGLRLDGEYNKSKMKLFPHQIKHFKNLETLSLEMFSTLSIPKWIRNLSNLKRLRLINNKLIDVPKSVGKLRNLEFVSLISNSLNKLPEEIESLEKLKELKLSFNQFKEFPKEVLGLHQLEYLNLSHNQVKVIPPEIGIMLSLKMLGLSGNPISALPDELLDMINIEEVFIGETNIKIDEEFKNELKKRKIQIFPSGCLEFEALRRKRCLDRR